MCAKMTATETYSTHSKMSVYCEKSIQLCDTFPTFLFRNSKHHSTCNTLLLC